MTVLSLAEATRRLGIDVKTLHRWLAEAQISLHCHPEDGRKKGVSEEHLQVLARLHQRSLTPLCEVPSVPTASPLPDLAAVVLTLPEQLCLLQAQIAALQQQVADLTRIITQHSSEPVIPAAATKPSKIRKPTAQALHSRRAATAKPKTPAKPVHVIPRVEYGGQGHYVVICPKKGLLPLEPDTQEWFAWVAKQDSFRFVGKGGSFTAHHEWRVPKGAWRAHRHIRNQSYTLRLAPNHELTIAVLEQAAQALQAHLT
jgi:predicted phage tail protein